MDMKRQHDFFTDLLHKLLVIHTHHPDVPMGKIITLALGVNSLAEVSDEQLLELIEAFYNEK